MKRIVANIVYFLGAAALGACCLSAYADSPAQPKEWTSPAAFASQLAAPVKVGSWSIQPPTGYTEIKTPSPDGSGDIYTWGGPKHDAHAGAAIHVIVAIPPKGQKEPFTTDQVLSNLVGNQHANRVNWKQSAIEQGTINGLPFEHITWQGSDISTAAVVHGFDYATQLADGKFIMLVGEDVEPFEATTLPLADASALTFKAK